MKEDRISWIKMVAPYIRFYFLSEKDMNLIISISILWTIEDVMSDSVLISKTINQPLQRNNTSGVSGVRYYKARSKFVARIKICQKDIHLGYYVTFEEAVQARNVGMECMFGEYGRYNDVPAAPSWIRAKVVEKCKRFAHLSVSEKFKSYCLSKKEAA